MKALKSIWNFLGLSSLTFYLLLLIVIDLLAGFFFFRAHPDLFEPLARMKIWEWIETVGITYLHATWWFLAFMVLLVLLVANTTVCTLNRVVSLLRRGPGSSGRVGYVLRFSPHVMHLGFVLILCSYCLSYVGGLNDQNNILLLGKTVAVPGSDMKLRLDTMDIDYYQGRRLIFFRDRAIETRFGLTFIDPDGAEMQRVLGLMSPIWHQGYSFHVRSFFPSKKARYQRVKYLNVAIRKDPGIVLFLLGTGVFSLGLLGYLAFHIRQYRRSKDKQR